MALTKVIGEGVGSLGTSSLTHGSDSGDTRFTLNSANQYTMVIKKAGDIAGQIGGGGADVLRFSNAAGATIMEMNAGQITMPLQPAFLVQATAVSNLGLNADHTIAFGTEVFDNNSDFASNVFTAPVTGKYQFNLSVRIDNLDDATAYYMVQIRTSNRDIQTIHGNSGYDADVVYMSLNISALVDMDAGDTSKAIIGVPSTGSAQADLHNVTRFSGYLVA